MQLDSWDVALLAMGGYVAVIALVRMMIAHRDRLLAAYREQQQLELLRQQQAAALLRQAEPRRAKAA